MLTGPRWAHASFTLPSLTAGCPKRKNWNEREGGGLICLVIAWSLMGSMSCIVECRMWATTWLQFFFWPQQDAAGKTNDLALLVFSTHTHTHTTAMKRAVLFSSHKNQYYTTSIYGHALSQTVGWWLWHGEPQIWPGYKHRQKRSRSKGGWSA